MITKGIFVITCLIAFNGCASFYYETRPFFNGHGQKVDCGNGKRMMSYELCRLDTLGY